MSIPSSKVAEAKPGAVEISGFARGPNTMPAPITGLPCFLYRVTAWEWLDLRKKWEKVAEETLHLPFFLEDSTGQLLIEPLGAELDLRSDFLEEYRSRLLVLRIDADSTDLPASVSAFLSRHGITRGHRFRVEETTIRANDRLFAVGCLSENPGVELRAVSGRNGHSEIESPTNHFRAVATSRSMNLESDAPAPRDAEVIRLEGGSAPSSSQEMTQQAKIAAALTRAGITKPEAWRAAGVPQEANPSIAVGETSLESANAEDAVSRASQSDRHAAIEDRQSSAMPAMVMMKGADDTSFLLSYRSQKEVISTVNLNSAAMLCGGAALAILGAALLFVRA